MGGSAAAGPRVFGVAYDDTELLGKLVTRGPAWPVAGVALHLANGAAVRRRSTPTSRRACRCPHGRAGRWPASPSTSRRWPLTAVTDRLHPARDDLPVLAVQPARLRPGDLAPPRCSASCSASSSAGSTRRRTRTCRPTSTSCPPTGTATSSRPSAPRVRSDLAGDRLARRPVGTTGPGPERTRRAGPTCRYVRRRDDADRGCAPGRGGLTATAHVLGAGLPALFTA